MSLMRALMATLFITFGLGSAASASVEAVGQFKNWRVFKATDNGQTTCYAATEATDLAPRTANHGKVVLYVSAWRGQTTGQPSAKVGFDFREDLPGKLIVGRSDWKLFTADNEAFAYDDDDRSIVRALKSGSTARIEAVSGRDTEVAYEFSLSGSAAAIDRALAICR